MARLDLPDVRRDEDATERRRWTRRFRRRSGRRSVDPPSQLKQDLLRALEASVSHAGACEAALRAGVPLNDPIFAEMKAKVREVNRLTELYVQQEL